MLRSLLFRNNTSAATATMTVTLAPSYIESSYLPNGAWTSDPVVPTVSGGTSPYTYLWSRVFGSSAISLAYSPSTKDMAFNASGTNQRYYAQFQCLATDSSSPAKTATANVNIAIGFNVSAYREPEPDVPPGSEIP